MWKNGMTNGFLWEAKVYDEGSVFGINGGRVSKLHVCKDHRDVYCYDRGLIFDEAPAGLIDVILKDATK